MYSAARILSTALFPIDAVLRQMPVQKVIDDLGALPSFNAGDQVKLRVDFGIEVNRAAVSKRFGRARVVVSSRLWRLGNGRQSARTFKRPGRLDRFGSFGRRRSLQEKRIAQSGVFLIHGQEFRG